MNLISLDVEELKVKAPFLEELLQGGEEKMSFRIRITLILGSGFGSVWQKYC